MSNARVRGVYGKPWSQLAKGVVLTSDVLHKLGACLVVSLSEESKKYFAKRGWTGEDPMQGPPVWDSFSHQIRGKSTVEIYSTFYGLKELVSEGGIPSRKMTWLTQEMKDRRPNRYHLTPGEKKRGMKVSGRLSKGERLPLVVPMKNNSGTLIFRTAPFSTSYAWVHPGFARFTFMETGIKKGRKRCADILMEEVASQILNGDPFK